MVLFLSTLKRELLSKKSVLIGLFFMLVAFLVGKYSGNLGFKLSDNKQSEIISTLLVLYALLAYLFSTVLFSGTISGEIESQTMRFLTPYLKRKSIYLAKFFAATIYFVVITIISLIVLFITAGFVSISVYSVLMIVGIYLYIESVVLLVSTLATSERASNLINLLISILFPVFYTATLLKDWFLLKAIQWIFPYHYLSKTWEIIFLFVLTTLLVFIGQKLFENKEI